MNTEFLKRNLLIGALVIGVSSIASAQSGEVPPPPPPPPGLVPPVQDQEDPVFTYVEQMPYYPEGDNALMKFLAYNIRYPEKSKDKGVMGTAFVNFIVGKDGKLRDIKIVRSSGAEDLDAEAVRVVGLMPNWKPGKMNGKPVSVSYNQPIKFILK